MREGREKPREVTDDITEFCHGVHAINCQIQCTSTLTKRIMSLLLLTTTSHNQLILAQLTNFLSTFTLSFNRNTQ
jgi:hypothetical protein